MLASGDPFHYGVGAQLAREVPADEMVTVPAPSAFSLAAARLGWPLAETTLLALNGRPLDLIGPHLHPGARLLALSAGAETPQALAQLLVKDGFGELRLVVLEALGGPRERIRTTRAGAFGLDAIDPLNTVAIEVVAGAQARSSRAQPALPIRCLSMTARSPSARCARSPFRRWRRGAASDSGISAPVPAR